MSANEIQSANSLFETHLDKNEANYTHLTPLTFLERSAAVYPDRVSVIHGDYQATWSETYSRCRRLASALRGRGIGVGDTVAVVAANIPSMYEAHFGVPMAGAVLNTINIRLDADAIAFMLEHGEARAVMVDKEFAPVVNQALKKIDRNFLVIDIDDPQAPDNGFIGEIEYNAFLNEGDPGYAWEGPQDEWQAISLNYTSGTTGNPKGVVYHHRGAYLLSMGNVLAWNMTHHPIYLWTLPMFHCNGWCFPWTLAAVAGTNICLRQVSAKGIFDALADHKATHFCGAPIVLSTVANAGKDERRELDHQVEIMTAASAPPAAILEAMEKEGFHVTHVYGLTEVYGPAVVCSWKEEWNDLPTDDKARLKARQGVRYHVAEGVDVLDPNTMNPVPADGKTMGEVMFKGNMVMKGYLKNPQATEEAFRGGWFHSGDLGVKHPDGYVELKDRSKDIIISGGENISSIELEDTLYRHPAVLEAAVVARPDKKWGETPCAFITLRDEAEEVSQEDIINFCREHMARFKAPKTVVFGPLPKTSTGKIQKHLLRDRVRNL